MSYNTNIAYTKEAFDEQIDYLHSFYKNFELKKRKEVNLSELFFVSGIDEDNNFPYKIYIEYWGYKTPGYFIATRLVVEYKQTRRDGSEIINEYYLVRNYSDMDIFLVKDNDIYYILTGHDYQGAVALNLDTMVPSYYLPKSSEIGAGWGITDYKWWSPEDRILAVEGCVWGGPYEIREIKVESFEEYDLSNIINEYDEDYSEAQDA